MGQIVERIENKRTVGSILDVMDEKYLKTKEERMLELMKKIVEFRTDENVEELMDKFGKIMTEVEKLNLVQNLNYTLTLLFVDRLDRDEQINKDDKYQLKDEIETKEGKLKVGNIAENMRRELRRLRVLDNREDVWKGTTHSTNYVQRDSR